MKYYYIYKLEHIETKEFYFGSRGCKCEPEKDNDYLGSMYIWKPDKTKLIKTIIKIFETREEAISKEADFIKENINNPLNRNYHIPNKGYHVNGMTTAKDKNGNTYCISVDDERLKTGELMGVNKGMISVRDINGNTFQVSIEDERFLFGELKHTTTGTLPVKDKNDKIFMINKNDERFLSGELVSVNKGKTLVKDKFNNKFWANTGDPRFLTGEIFGIKKGISPVNKGVPMSEEQKEKLRKPKTEEHKKKLSEIKKDKQTIKILCLENKIIYSSIKEAAEILNLTVPNIVNVLKGRAEKTKGYSFKYIDKERIYKNKK
jgi:hypothetical protein